MSPSSLCRPESGSPSSPRAPGVGVYTVLSALYTVYTGSRNSFPSTFFTSPRRSLLSCFLGDVDLAGLLGDSDLAFLGEDFLGESFRGESVTAGAAACFVGDLERGRAAEGRASFVVSFGLLRDGETESPFSSLKPLSLLEDASEISSLELEG